ncbi:uncharacterized protein LOC123896113 [Trifolium pratense]|uniref:uncharacterized protein LOC123896113 n=1 Tax=Trifolium pratense TaxID=57577 RepID=UPI001E696CEB|nr:uncharacterized protein LOC123896113 [Trifolium pratense]
MRERESERGRSRERGGRREEDQGWQEVRGRRKGRRRSLNSRPDIATVSRRDRGDIDQYTTYFFSEFPDSFDAKAMLNIFQFYGNIFEVVIPAKRDKGGRRFGFARFDQVKDVRRFGIELDNIIIGRDKIYVNPPRFQRDTRTRRPHKQEEDGSKMENQHRSNDEGSHQKNCAGPSFAQVAQSNGEQKQKIIISFEPEREVIRMLSSAFVGVVPHPGLSYNIQEEFHRQGYFGVKITPLGANLVLLEDQEEGEVKALMEDARGWLEQWFKEIRPWSPREVDNERLVWLRVYGVPIHAWNDKFFSLIAKQYGIFLNADDTTSKKLSMDVARILIRTPGLKAIDDFISVKVDDELFQIRLIEDSHGPMRIAVPLKGSKEGRDDDSSSSEDEEGDFPVMEVEEEVVEREGDVEGQQLLALTNFINDNNSLPNGFGIVSPGSNGREGIKEQSNNFIEEENLNNSNSKVGESLGEDVNALGVVDCNVISELGHSKSPNHSICYCNLINMNAGGGNSRSVEKAELGQKPNAISSKRDNKGGSKVCEVNLCSKPKSLITSKSIKGGKEHHAGGGIRSGNQKAVAGSIAGSIPISIKNNTASTIVLTDSRRSNCDHIIPIKHNQKACGPAILPPRVTGGPSTITKRRSSTPSQSISESSSNSSMVREGVSRNPVGKYKVRKATENSVSSAGSILCCSSLNSSDIRNCNKNFWNKHDIEVNGKLWEDVQELGIQGEEEDAVYVERLRINELKDKEASRLREQINQAQS